MKKFCTKVTLCISLFFLLFSCDFRPSLQNSVSVVGVGIGTAQPDVAVLNINISHTAATTKLAKDAVDKTMKSVLKVLQEEKIESKAINTLYLNYEIEYEYERGRRVVLGRRARQTVSVKIDNIKNEAQKLSVVLDKLASIDKVEVQNIYFDIKKKAELYKESRELAYQKAFDKAQQYARLSNRRLGKVINISEQGGGYDVTFREGVAGAFNNASMRDSYADDCAKECEVGFGSYVPTGEQSVTSKLYVVFELK